MNAKQARFLQSLLCKIDFWRLKVNREIRNDRQLEASIAFDCLYDYLWLLEQYLKPHGVCGKLGGQTALALKRFYRNLHQSTTSRVRDRLVKIIHRLEPECQLPLFS